MIWERIVYLGLTERTRPPYDAHEWTQVEDDILRAEYGNGRDGAHSATRKILALHPDWTHGAVAWRAQALGVTNRRDGPPRRWDQKLDVEGVVSCLFVRHVLDFTKRVALIRARLNSRNPKPFVLSADIRVITDGFLSRSRIPFGVNEYIHDPRTTYQHADIAASCGIVSPRGQSAVTTSRAFSI